MLGLTAVGLAVFGLAVLGLTACRTTAVALDPADPPDDRSSPVERMPLDEVPHWEVSTDLPVAVSNNAIAGLDTPAGPRVFSMLGLHSGKTHADVTADVWMFSPGLDPSAGTWEPTPPPPDSPGRLAATAQAVAGRVILFGGYTVQPDGHEVSVERVDIFDPTSGQWSAAAPMPVPVDDAVSGVWRDRYVVLVSGWSQRDNVDDVQIYDATTDTWMVSTPIPGAPVFGHAGGVVDDTVVYCDGVAVHATAPKFRAEAACFAGRLLATEGRITIEWKAIPDHPGPARYRMAAGPQPDRGWVVFAGGTGRPYNYDGTGYDGVPAAAVDDVFAWDTRRQAWVSLPPLPEPRMDHRGLVWLDHTLWLVGGLDEQRSPSTTVWRLRQ